VWLEIPEISSFVREHLSCSSVIVGKVIVGKVIVGKANNS